MTFTTPDFGEVPAPGSCGDAAAPVPAPARLAHAVVGLGRFGSTHVRRLASLPDFRLCAVVDGSPAARPSADIAALPLLASVDELAPGIESATVATCDEAHATVALALMRRGCHVLVEKPLCLDPLDGAAMLRVARQHGVTLSTGHIERFNAALDDARLASLLRASLKHRGRSSPFLRFRRFSCRQASAVDSVLDLMVHDLDLFAWICAIPFHEPLQLIHRHVGARSVRARVRLGGLVAELESGYGTAPPSAQMRVADGRRHELLDLRRPTGRELAGEDALTRQYQAFHRAIRGKSGRMATGADGLAAVTRAHQILRA
jgi:UDP-N-acetylglucosamine 3-dehydrogenase